MSTDGFHLEAEAGKFATDLEAMIDAVLPGRHELQASTVKGKTHSVVEPKRTEQDNPQGIDLRVRGRFMGKLEFQYLVVADRTNHYLKVVKSSIAIRSVAMGEPVIRLEFEPGAHSSPVSHWHVHAENGAVSAWLALSEPDTEKQRQRWAMAAVHLPTGGERWRPCLEDVLEMLVTDFGLDTRDGWKDALAEGRADWRKRQLKASIRDDPKTSADTLRRLGYNVTDPTTPPETRLRNQLRY